MSEHEWFVHSATWPMPGGREVGSEVSLEDHLAAASEIVLNWPEWKRNVLQSSMSPTRAEPRKVVRHEA